MATDSAQVNFVPLDHPLGRRISVVGGGGKTTLARSIGRKLDLTFIELDAIHWLPNWVEREAGPFRRLVTKAIDAAPGGWVVDGNYTSKLDGEVVGRADTVVWVNLPWRIRLWRIFKRSLQRSWDKQQICGENTESWRHNLSRDSLWWWYITNRRRIITAGDRFLPWLRPGVPVIDIRSPRDLDRFYKVHGLSRD